MLLAKFVAQLQIKSFGDVDDPTFPAGSWYTRSTFRWYGLERADRGDPTSTIGYGRMWSIMWMPVLLIMLASVHRWSADFHLSVRRAHLKSEVQFRRQRHAARRAAAPDDSEVSGHVVRVGDAAAADGSDRDFDGDDDDDNDGDGGGDGDDGGGTASVGTRRARSVPTLAHRAAHYVESKSLAPPPGRRNARSRQGALSVGHSPARASSVPGDVGAGTGMRRPPRPPGARAASTAHAAGAGAGAGAVPGYDAGGTSTAHSGPSLVRRFKSVVKVSTAFRRLLRLNAALILETLSLMSLLAAAITHLTIFSVVQVVVLLVCVTLGRSQQAKRRLWLLIVALQLVLLVYQLFVLLYWPPFTTFWQDQFPYTYSVASQYFYLALGPAVRGFLLIPDFICLMVVLLTLRQWKLDASSPLATLREKEAASADAAGSNMTDGMPVPGRAVSPAAHRRMLLLKDVAVALSSMLKTVWAKRQSAQRGRRAEQAAAARRALIKFKFTSTWERIKTLVATVSLQATLFSILLMVLAKDSQDLINIGYAAVTLYLLFHTTAIMLEGNRKFWILRAYNLAVLTLQLVRRVTDVFVSAVGCWLLVVGCWLLVVGCWLLAVGCWLLVVGCWLLVVGCWLLAVGCWLLVVGCWLLVLYGVGAMCVYLFSG